MMGMSESAGLDCIARRRRRRYAGGVMAGLPQKYRVFTLIKFLLLALGIWIVYRIVKSYGRSLKRDEAPPQSQGGEDMVRCAHCGVHLPRSESIVSQGEFFCSNEHRQLHQK
jgi:uncharacterized protein